ncbi:hypothetical protein AVEN_34826-1 [Araneus ventricosus]|uniref:Uncharacterized protein n=1 Tax=Araneus ventricosus TaxID=182803 RepID=A0A4Y2N4K8_ARAVE|nr:hypothetical protein AVEN_34826-1 [Araneus ventricosus]
MIQYRIIFLCRDFCGVKHLPGSTANLHNTPNALFTTDCYLPIRKAPLHCGMDVRTFLDTTFPNRWIGRGGPIAWPPKSPDITPLDFFLLGLHQTQSLLKGDP